MESLSPSDRAALEAVVRLDESYVPLTDFVSQAWSLVDPAPFVGGWHLDAICDHLEACSRGDIKRLIINVPPGTSKTMMALIMWPAWEWTFRPQGKWMCATYEQPLSYTKAHICQRLLESEWYRDRWGDVWLPDPREWSVAMLVNSRGGFRYSTSKGSGAIGRHADRQIVDDPHKPTDILGGAASGSSLRVDLTKTYEWYTQTMATRLIADPSNPAVRVVIMQRLHEADLTGKLLAEFGDGYTHLMIPQAYEPQRKCWTILAPATATEPAKTWEDPRTTEGELMCPARMDAAFVANRKKELGSRGHAGQEQQRPSPEGGGIFDRSWLGHFYTKLPASASGYQIQSWDMAFKKTADSSKVAGHVWAKDGANLYLVDRVTERMTFMESVQALRTLTAKHPQALTKLVEDKANGTAVMDMLRNEVPGLVPVEPEGGKESRASAVTPLWEAGNVWLPDPSIAPWVHDFIEAVATFPGVFTDDVDAMSQALIYLYRRTGKAEIHTGGRRATAGLFQTERPETEWDLDDKPAGFRGKVRW